MFNLPEKTLYNRRIPKSKFYEKLQANTKLKEKFVDQIDCILWQHKLSQQTINLDPTDEVQEIQIFEIQLKQKELAKEVLESIDRAIPYPLLFVLRYQGQVKLVIAYKSRNKNDENKYVIDSYFQSPWQHPDEITLNLTNALNLQAVYEGIIKSLIPIKTNSSENAQAAIERQKQLDSLQGEIAKLEAKVKTEKQFNKKVQYNLQLQKKQQQLQQLLAE